MGHIGPTTTTAYGHDTLLQRFLWIIYLYLFSYYF